MARYKSTVEGLAKEVGFSVEETAVWLCEAGVRLGPNNVISKKWIARARKALYLPNRPSCVKSVKSKASPTTTQLLPREELSPDKREVIAESIPPCPSKSEVIEWRQVGKIQHIEYVSLREVETIHWVLVEDFKVSKDPIKPPGVCNINLLQSAVGRPQTAIADVRKYPTVVMAGASLVYGLVLNHPFHNGNKRTAMVSLLVFLDKNGVLMTNVNEDDLYKFFLDVARHGLKESQKLSADEETILIADWLDQRTRKINRSEQVLKFHELRAILSKYNAVLHYGTRGNRRIITRFEGRLELQSKFNARNNGDEIGKAKTQKIRYDLELDEEHGYDSDIFYNADQKIPEFINKYRNVLNRLAKV